MSNIRETTLMYSYSEIVIVVRSGRGGEEWDCTELSE